MEPKLEIPSDMIRDSIQEGFNSFWAGVVEPQIQNVIDFSINNPLETVAASIAGLALVIGVFRVIPWVIDQINSL